MSAASAAASAAANSRAWSRCLAALSHADLLLHVQEVEKEKKKLQEENKKLKEQTDGIMEEEQRFEGCNAYEKFLQVVAELNYDEQWITELKAEKKKLVLKVACLEELVLGSGADDWEA